MPGVIGWRSSVCTDTGHKALMPGVTLRPTEHNAQVKGGTARLGGVGCCARNAVFAMTSVAVNLIHRF